MIKVVLIAILLVLSPLAKAEILFQDEDVWDAFVGQDFDANLVKAEEGDARAQYLIGRAYLFGRSEEHTSELQSRPHLVCRLLLEKKKKKKKKRERNYK